MPIRKPRTSLPRRPDKPPDEPKKTPDTNNTPVEKFNSKEENPTEKGFPNRSKKPKPDDTQPETEEEWEPVTDRHQPSLTLTDRHRPLPTVTDCHRPLPTVTDRHQPSLVQGQYDLYHHV